MTDEVIFTQMYRGDEWRLQVQIWKGRTSANWRKWYRKGDEWRAGSEGCTIPLERLADLTAALMAYHGLEPPETLESGL